jgi:hypothetical protein
MISGFRSEVDQICALPGYYAAYSGNSVPTFRDNLSVPYFLIFEEGADLLYRNVGKESPLYVFEAFAATEINKVFSGRKPRQDVKVSRRFGS